ncbi:MAG: tripartite tricarboxylate transporter substrate binding protein [Betaproteobacteria bacterium]|nr:tripartite tricarboxylate transporter substrate binding protein [Betaproteobacteria bacterium]
MNGARVLQKLLLSAVLTIPALIGAQSYPAKPVRVVVPFPPGATGDIVTRHFTPKLAEALEQQFIVENRAGAAGNIGAESVAHAPADGYTLLTATGSNASNQSLYKNLSFDIGRDFEPIAMLASVPFLLVVYSSLEAKNVAELIQLAKARPGRLNFASTGIGGTNHLTGELFKSMAGINIVHVAYKGTPNVLPDLIAGRVQMIFASIVVMLPHVKAGRLRALAVTSAKRSVLAPELPTINESGLAGFESGTWYALLAPAGTPRDIVARLNAAIIRIGQAPEIRERLVAEGAEPLGGTPEQTGAFVKSEIVKWSKIIAGSGARAE